LNKKEYLTKKSKLLENAEKQKASLSKLHNCDNILNKHSIALLSIFDECRKEWKTGQHLIVRKNNYTFPLIATSSAIGLIEDNTKSFKPNTLIMQSLNKNTFQLFFWKDRYEFSLYKYVTDTGTEIEFNDNFNIQKVPYIKDLHYVDFDKKPYINKIEAFKNVSLVALALKETRSKGAINSNKNSQTQSLRKKGRIVDNCNVLMEFDSPNAYNTENKTMLDAYRIAAGKYGYQKCYRSFVREMKAGKSLELRNDKNYSIICHLVVNNPVNNIIYTDLNLNKENTSINRDVDTSIEHSSKNNIIKPDLLFSEYEKWCKDVKIEDRWAFEEWLKIKTTT